MPPAVASSPASSTRTPTCRSPATVRTSSTAGCRARRTPRSPRRAAASSPPWPRRGARATRSCSRSPSPASTASSSPAPRPREAKSGYGLDRDNELKQLRVLREAAARHPVEIAPTAMPGHEVPPEWRHDPDGYVNHVVAEIYPAIAAAGIWRRRSTSSARRGVFSPAQTRRLLADAGRHGWRIHLHADELTDLGGAELAAELGAASASHLLHVSDIGIAALAAAGVVAVALPGVSFFLRDRYAPVRTLVDAGVPVALATDCNPGSSHTESMPAVMALGLPRRRTDQRGGARRRHPQRRRRARPRRPRRQPRAGQAGRPRRPRRPLAEAPRLPLRRQPRPPRRQGGPRRRPRRP